MGQTVCAPLQQQLPSECLCTAQIIPVSEGENNFGVSPIPHLPIGRRGAFRIFSKLGCLEAEAWPIGGSADARRYSLLLMFCLRADEHDVLPSWTWTTSLTENALIPCTDIFVYRHHRQGTQKRGERTKCLTRRRGHYLHKRYEYTRETGNSRSS